ncbi:MAG: hypothetical protein ACRDNJ_04295 [Solirubrobacteraceae bacterium]
MIGRHRVNGDLTEPAIAIVGGAIVALMALAGVAGPVRLVLAVLFLLAGTGLALIPRSTIDEPWTRLLIVVTTSIVIDTLVATALAAAGTLSLASGVIVLEVICLAGTAGHAVRALPEPRGGP